MPYAAEHSGSPPTQGSEHWSPPCALCISGVLWLPDVFFPQALRSSDKSTKPVYVSVGHRISLDTAVRLTSACCRYRVPEPIRQVMANPDHGCSLKNETYHLEASKW